MIFKSTFTWFDKTMVSFLGSITILLIASILFFQFIHARYYKKPVLTPIKVVVKPTTAPQPKHYSSFTLKLAGIITEHEPENRTALIRYNHQPERFYQQGDKLPSGAMIKRIKREKVIVVYHDKSTTVSINKVKKIS